METHTQMLEALKAAVPHLERLAGTCPTQPAGVMRRNQAAKDLATVRAAIAKATTLYRPGEAQ